MSEYEVDIVKHVWEGYKLRRIIANRRIRHFITRITKLQNEMANLNHD